MSIKQIGRQLGAVQGAAIKLYKGLACPLDDFELLLCSLSGPDGMTYPLCPFCYSNPPFEGIQKVHTLLPTLLLLCWAAELCHVACASQGSCLLCVA